MFALLCLFCADVACVLCLLLWFGCFDSFFYLNLGWLIASFYLGYCWFALCTYLGVVLVLCSFASLCWGVGYIAYYFV